MLILKKDNVERIVSNEYDKAKLISLGYTEIKEEVKEVKKEKKKKTEGAS